MRRTTERCRDRLRAPRAALGLRAGAGAMLMAALLAGLTTAGCGSERGAEKDALRAGGDGDPPRLVILGIDGFDWTIVDPLVERGAMPVLAGLLERGTRADLLTLVPLEKSPVIWTTIATGKLPREQGRGFLINTSTDEDGPAVYTAWNRANRAFWNILPDNGIRVAVLGWLETWPAERIDGVIVSDYVQYDVSESEKQQRVRHRTFPDGVIDEIDSLIVFPQDVPEERLAELVGGRPGSDEARPSAFGRGLRDLRWILAGDLTFTALGREFLRNRPEEVVAIYLRGPDAVCHKFWGEREHRAAGTGDPDRVEWFGETVDRYFEATDRLLGELVSEIDFEQTNLFLVSDHGFQGARRGMDGALRLGIWMHRELGTALLVGPWASGEGVRVAGARVQDVLPTVLHALELPVAEDMDGTPALELLGPAGGRNRPIDTIPTWETGEPPDLPDVDASPVAELIEERIRALGYVE